MQSSAPPRPCFCSPHVGLYTPNRARELYTCSSDAQDVVINGSFISSINGTNPSSDDGAPTGPVSISSVTHQPTNVYAKSTHAPCLSSMDPFACVWDEREGYTQYSMERSRVAEIQEMINVVQREKETLQRTASNCGMGVREELQKLSNLLTNAEGRLVVAKQHLAEHGANTNMDTDVKSTPEHYSHSKDTQKYVESWAEWDMQSCSSSDVAMGGDCDVVIDDAVRVGSDFSGANTKTACSSTSASSLPLSIGFHAGAESNSQLAEDGQLHAGAAACICVHAEAVECGGLDMRELKEAMVKESAVQEPLVSIIGILLDKTVARNDSLQRVSDLQDFENHRKCTLTASAYLSRMMRYGACSPSCAVVGVMYLQRLKTKDPTISVTSYNLQRLLLVSVMVAHKYLDDLYYSNKHWARIGGVTVQEINHLEATVLQLLDWKMHVSREEYLEYLEGLGCGPRGSITDTDSWANDLKQLQELIEQGEGARLHDQAHNEHRSDAFQAPQLHTPVAIEPSPTYAMYLESQHTHTEISVAGSKFGLGMQVEAQHVVCEKMYSKVPAEEQLRRRIDMREMCKADR